MPEPSPVPVATPAQVSALVTDKFEGKQYKSAETPVGNVVMRRNPETGISSVAITNVKGDLATTDAFTIDSSGAIMSKVRAVNNLSIAGAAASPADYARLASERPSPDLLVKALESVPVNKKPEAS